MYVPIYVTLYMCVYYVCLCRERDSLLLQDGFKKRLFPFKPIDRLLTLKTHSIKVDIHHIVPKIKKVISENNSPCLCIKQHKMDC